MPRVFLRRNTVCLPANIDGDGRSEASEGEKLMTGQLGESSHVW